MRLHARAFAFRALLGSAVLATLAACNSDATFETSEGSVAVTASALSSADVTKVTITITAPDLAAPIVTNLVKVGGRWQGTIGKVPAGSNRSFHGDAFNAANAIVYAGDVSSVTIQKNTTAAVAMLLQQTAAPVPFRNSAPVIDGLVASTSSPAVGDAVNLALTAHDVDPGDSLIYTWAATGGSVVPGPGGTTATWTAPAATGEYTITARVTDSKGSIAAMAFVSNVNAGKGSAAISASFNTWPLVSGIVATPSRLDTGEAASIALDATDVDGDAVTYAWSASCSGAFSDPSTRNPSFTLAAAPAGGTCDLNVSVADARGGVNTGKLTIKTGPAPVAAVAPQVDETFQSTTAYAPGDGGIELRVAAHDPQGAPLSFSWTSDIGTLGAPSSTTTRSSVTWTGPAAFPPGTIASVTATVTSTTGSTTTHRFTIGTPCLQTPPGLVSWWRGESNALDTRNVNPGTPIGNVAYVPGKVGRAFAFDGTSYVTAASAGLPVAAADRTIEAWVRLDGPSPTGQSAFAGYGLAEFDQANILGELGDRSPFFSQYGSGSGSPNPLSLSQWHHLAATVANGLVTFFVDGTETGVASDVPFATPAGTAFTIGAFLPSGLRLVGAVDELSVYDRALTAAEVTSVANAGGYGKCP